MGSARISRMWSIFDCGELLAHDTIFNRNTFY
jgi:hypothetical protein